MPRRAWGALLWRVGVAVNASGPSSVQSINTHTSQVNHSFTPTSHEDCSKKQTRRTTHDALLQREQCWPFRHCTAPPSGVRRHFVPWLRAIGDP